MSRLSHQQLRVEFRKLLASESCYHTASVFDPMSARIAADLGFEAGILGGSVASLQVLAAPDFALITLSEFTEQATRIGRVAQLPIIADADRKVSELYDMIHPNASATVTVRSLFVIDPARKVRLVITYPASTGRNFDEILRVIDSLQLTDHHSVATPGNWKDGDDVVIVPSLQDEAVLKEKFPQGYTAVRPYLRMTPQPARG